MTEKRICKTCGGTRFIVDDARMAGCRAPAVECARCHAVEADVNDSCTKHDLDSARMAIAANLGVIAEWSDEADTVVDQPRSVG